jgi:AraC-like DNA-binding protein
MGDVANFAECLPTEMLVRRERMVAALSACASFLVRNFRTLTCAEVDLYIEALLALLPLDAAPTDRSRNSRNTAKLNFQPKLIDFIEENIRNPHLTVEMAAKHFGISTRYVHKICAATGKTFAATVTSRRLDLIHRELGTFGRRRRSVSSLAFYWGFDSISAFNRAFKRRFGAPPRMCMAKAKGAALRQLG